MTDRFWAHPFDDTWHKSCQFCFQSVLTEVNHASNNMKACSLLMFVARLHRGTATDRVAVPPCVLFAARQTGNYKRNARTSYMHFRVLNES